MSEQLIANAASPILTEFPRLTRRLPALDIVISMLLFCSACLVSCSSPQASPTASLIPSLTFTAPPSPQPTRTPLPTPTPAPTVTPTPNPLAGLQGMVLVSAQGAPMRLLAANGLHQKEMSWLFHEVYAYSPALKAVIGVDRQDFKVYKADPETGQELELALLTDQAYPTQSRLQVSPDGTRVAFSNYGVITIVNLLDGELQQIPYLGARHYSNGVLGYCSIYALLWKDDNQLAFYAGREYPQVVFAPSGERSMNIECDSNALFVADLSRGTYQRTAIEEKPPLTSLFLHLAVEYPQGAFSPDGSMYAYADGLLLALAYADGTRQTSSIVLSPLSFNLSPTWSYDSQQLIVYGSLDGVNYDLWIIPADLTREALRLEDCHTSICLPLLWIPSLPEWHPLLTRRSPGEMLETASPS